MAENSLKVGWFLATRQLKRSNMWATVLIVFIMMLTFLNLVVVSGVLIGLVEGSSKAFRQQYSADLLIKDLPEKNYIQNSPNISRLLETLPDVEAISTRYLESGKIEANYRTKRKNNDNDDEAGTTIVGIDPAKEDRVTQLSKRLIAGTYLKPDDEGYILVGARLLDQYSVEIGRSTVANVGIGTKVRIKIDDTISKEVEVKGIVKSKVQAVDSRIYFVDRELRKMLGRTDYSADEIVVKLIPNASPEKIQKELLNSGIGKDAWIQTWHEAQGDFFDQISKTFGILGNFLGAISLAVASITVFIVIFINAVTRRKYIGILKGIGISARSIELSYVFQSMFYVVVGASAGCLIVFGFLKPFIDAHPIDFPFSDGILVATVSGTVNRVLLLALITIIAGYVPARMIVKRNTLDSILGR